MVEQGGKIKIVQNGSAPGAPDVYNTAYADFSANFIVPKMIQRVVVDGMTIDDAILTIGGLAPAALAEMATVQNYRITKLEAIYHVVEHFSQHTGQIIFATKLFFIPTHCVFNRLHRMCAFIFIARFYINM